MQPDYILQSLGILLIITSYFSISIPKDTMTIFSHINSLGMQYFLNKREVRIKSGVIQTIYFFSKDQREETGAEAVPAGYEVMESSRSHLPLLRKA